MSTAETTIQTHCDKIDSLAAQQNEMVAAMNARMERDAETIRVLREALQKIVNAEPCLDGGGGVFYPHYDGDGELIGEQPVDPVGILGDVFTMAKDALNATEHPV